LELSLTEGTLPLRSIRLAQGIRKRISVTLDGRECAHHLDGGALILEQDVVVPAGGKLVVRI
jgi:hypothetical protein